MNSDLPPERRALNPLSYHATIYIANNTFDKKAIKSTQIFNAIVKNTNFKQTLLTRVAGCVTQHVYKLQVIIIHLSF